jgi:predicted DNA-binding transcriptional regulator YafY
LTKLVQLMPPKLRHRVDALQEYTVPAALSGPVVDAGTLTAIAQACRDSEELRFGYTARDGTSTTRRVQPHRLVSLGRRWYLVAWDAQRQDWRSFRVDRLVSPTSDGIRFRPREVPGGDAAAFVQSGIATAPTRYRTDVVVQAPAAEVTQVVGNWGAVEPMDDGSCRLTMSTDSLDWPAMVLGSVGAPFEVVSPPELTAHLRRIVALFTQSVAATASG